MSYAFFHVLGKKREDISILVFTQTKSVVERMIEVIEAFFEDKRMQCKTIQTCPDNPFSIAKFASNEFASFRIPIQAIEIFEILQW